MKIKGIWISENKGYFNNDRLL